MNNSTFLTCLTILLVMNSASGFESHNNSYAGLDELDQEASESSEMQYPYKDEIDYDSDEMNGAYIETDQLLDVDREFIDERNSKNRLDVDFRESEISGTTHVADGNRTSPVNQPYIAKTRKNESVADIRTSHMVRAINLTDVNRKVILNFHNKKRREVRPRAADMLEMRYDLKLERLAQHHSRKCAYVHNKNRHVAGFRSVGENLYMRSGFSNDINAVLIRAAFLWHKEKRNYSILRNKCWKGTCTHYTQMVWAKTYAVGCGVSTCANVDGYKRAQIVVCNYGPAGNVRSIYGRVQRPYMVGRGCSKCPKGRKCLC